MGFKLKPQLLLDWIIIFSQCVSSFQTFFYCAMADGIFKLLKKTRVGINAQFKVKIGNLVDVPRELPQRLARPNMRPFDRFSSPIPS